MNRVTLLTAAVIAAGTAVSCNGQTPGGAQVAPPSTEAAPAPSNPPPVSAPDSGPTTPATAPTVPETAPTAPKLSPPVPATRRPRDAPCEITKELAGRLLYTWRLAYNSSGQLGGAGRDDGRSPPKWDFRYDYREGRLAVIIEPHGDGEPWLLERNKKGTLLNWFDGATATTTTLKRGSRDCVVAEASKLPNGAKMMTFHDYGKPPAPCSTDPMIIGNGELVLYNQDSDKSSYDGAPAELSARYEYEGVGADRRLTAVTTFNGDGTLSFNFTARYECSVEVAAESIPDQ